jgi:hypothetical protein
MRSDELAQKLARTHVAYVRFNIVTSSFPRVYLVRIPVCVSLALPRWLPSREEPTGTLIPNDSRMI